MSEVRIFLGALERLPCAILTVRHAIARHHIMQAEQKTQIYLSKVEHRALVRRARAEKRPMAAIIREAVSDYLKRPVAGSAWRADPIANIVAIADGHADDSASIDDVLYGAGT